VNLYLVFAMQRSGQHGVINWVCTQHGDITHYNNPMLNADETQFVLRRADVDLTVYGNGTDALANLENFQLTRWDSDRWADKPVIRNTRLTRILIIRRFRNWLASTSAHPGNDCMRKPNVDPAAHVKMQDKIERYGWHLQAAMVPLDDVIVIRYDDWFQSVDYRKVLSARLGLPFSDSGLNRVPRFANGSTFDQRKYDGQAQHMRVLERFKQVAGTEPYDTYIKKFAVIDDLSEELFSSSPLKTN
jgi:hypothetical protein